MEPIIQIQNVTKTFVGKENQVEALKGISLDIQKGDIYGIIGMSGAGKSTLVRCLNFLEKPTTGTVLVENKDLSGLSEKELRRERTEIAMIFQHFNLLMQRNVVDNVCFPMEIVGVKKADARKRAMELLKIVGLAEKAKSYPADRSREWRLQEHWQIIRRFCFVMRQPVRWIRQPQNLFYSYYSRLTENMELPSLLLLTKWQLYRKSALMWRLLTMENWRKAVR